MPTAGSRTVGIALTTELACYRDVIRGINAYAAMQANWQVELFAPHEPLDQLVHDRNIAGWIFGPIHDTTLVTRAMTAVNWKGVAVAAQFKYHGLPGLVETESDDIAVGRLAADHLRSKGFQHFAFVGTEAEWSDLREQGFQTALAEAGFTVSTLMPEAKVASDARGWRMPHFGREVLDWLNSLPRPLGLFACNDLRGRALADLCHTHQIRVPDEVAILSVDNDDLICDFARPQLSSVAIPWKKIGFQAAVALDQMLAGKKTQPRRILVGPECVIERQSTDTLAISDLDVAAALRFIRTHAHEPINVEDVLQHLPVSRRSLEKRFREIIGRSPLEEIRKAHTDRAKYLLAETDLSMPAVAEKSGFSSAAWFSKAFHDLVGETPTQYRQRFKTR
jgi:LacI family transcriptional regulator